MSSCLAAAMAATLDALSAAVFLVDAEGHIVHANMAGYNILAAGDMLFSAAGRLAARDAVIDQRLRDGLTTNRRSDTRVKGIAMPLAVHGKAPYYVAHIVPLVHWRTGAKSAATTALILNEAAPDTPSLPQIIAEVFRLTPTELRVLLAIVEIGPVPEVAVALGIAESTVKTHLGRLFVKTGAGRQADLVKLVAGFRNPLLR